MPLNVDTLQRQLEVAQQTRSAIESQLDGQEPKKHAKWRQANAAVSALEKRLDRAQNRSVKNEATE